MGDPDAYDPINGTPDINDVEQEPPIDNAYLGGVAINAEMHFTPIDTDISPTLYGRYNFAPATLPSDAFNGMLFYQRRGSEETVKITGNAALGTLEGTIYAKWALFDIAGQGTYDAQFVVGRIKVSGQGNVTILSAGGGRGRANQVFLVE